MAKGTSIHDAILIDSDDDLAPSQPPAKRRKVGPFAKDSDSEEDSAHSTSELARSIITERIAALKTEKEPKEERVFKTEPPSFVNILSNSIPVHLLPFQHYRDLIRLFNHRLSDAVDDKVSLADITIGEDHLPTWPGRRRAHLQSIQEDVELRLWAHELSKVLRNEVRDKLRTQLEQAKAQAVEVRDIRLCKGLRLQWKEDGGWPVKAEEEWSDTESLTEGFTPPKVFSSMDSQSASLSSPATSLPNYDADIDTDLESLDSKDAEMNLSSSDSDESSSDGSSNCSPGPDPNYDENSKGPPNTFHDAHVIGGPPHVQSMDFEAYLASSGSDLDDLPEVEFAVDGEAYQFHYPEAAAEAIDIDLPESSTFRITDEHIDCITSTDEDDEDDEDQHPDQGNTKMPRWASPTVVLEALKKKHWVRMCKADRDKWTKKIEAAGKGALKFIDGDGEEVDTPEEDEPESPDDESEASVEDESGDERAMRAVPRQADQGVQKDGSDDESEGDSSEDSQQEDDTIERAAVGGVEEQSASKKEEAIEDMSQDGEPDEATVREAAENGRQDEGQVRGQRQDEVEFDNDSPWTEEAANDAAKHTMNEREHDQPVAFDQEPSGQEDPSKVFHEETSNTQEHGHESTQRESELKPTAQEGSRVIIQIDSDSEVAEICEGSPADDDDIEEALRLALTAKEHEEQLQCGKGEDSKHATDAETQEEVFFDARATPIGENEGIARDQEEVVGIQEDVIMVEPTVDQGEDSDDDFLFEDAI